MTQTPEAPLGYAQQPPKKSRAWMWIVGSLVLAAVVLGTCVKGAMTGFSAMSDRAAASKEMTSQFLKEGLLPADDPIYSRRAGVTPEAVEQLNRLVRQFGALEEVSDAVCGVRTAANTDPSKAGTFATCNLTAQTEFSPATVVLIWVREDESWKIYAFNVNYTDQSILLDRAEQARQPAEAEETEDVVDETASGD